MIATPVPSAALGNNSDIKTLNVSSNTSGSSTASSVLIRSTKPPINTDSSHSSRSDRRSSSSSFSSTNSQRVSIKAKYLKEVKSPFEVDSQSKQAHDEYIPPALPGNLPVDYEQRRDTADTVNLNQSELHALSLDNKKDKQHLPGKERISTGDGATYKSIGVGQVDSSEEKVAFRANSVHKPPSSSSLLKQGAPTSSHAILSHSAGPSNDVRITQFALGGKQRVLKDQLLKRQEQAAPVKRYIRPTMVSSDQRASATSHGHPEGNMAEEIKNPRTVAAVTAAAVAATVPIVKAQTDLETKMDAMMEKLVLLQELTNRGQHPLTHQRPEEQHTTAVTNPNHQGGELQKTLDEVMSKRLQQLEKIQEKQSEWQEKLMSAAYQSRLESHSAISSHAHRPTKSQFDSNHIGPEDKQPLKKEDSHRTDPGLSGHAASTVRPENKQPFKDQQRGISHENLEMNAERHKRYTPAVTLHSYPPQQSAGKAPNEGVFFSDNDTPVDKTAHQPSPLDTPAPRRHAPRPLTQNVPSKISHTGRGLLEEILTSHDEEERRLVTRGRQIPTSSYPKTSHSSVTRGLISPESGAETKAAGVVHQLSNLKKEMKEMKIDLIKSLHSEGTVGVVEHKAVPSTVSDIHQEAERDWDRLMQRRLEPAPLDVYLRKRPSVPVTLPASSHLKPPLSPSQYNAPVPSSMCAEARAVLDQVQSSRACLQANLEAVIRAKEQEEFYNYLDSLHLEGEAAEKAQLRYKVGRMIAAIDEEIKHEVPIKPRMSQSSTQGIGNSKSEKPSNLASLASRPVKAGTKKKPVSSRIDSGLRNQTTSKGEDKNVVKGRHNKENFAQTKKLPISQAKRHPAIDHNQDEAYLTRVYGKALYQTRRSTMKKEPYLKYSTSSPQSKPARSLSAAQVKGTEMKSAKTQTTVHKLGSIPVPNPNSQFFFDPYPTLQAPSTLQQEEPTHQPAPLTAPSHGQLIPMAVPLGPPQRGGLTQPVTIKTDGLERGVVKDLERRDVQSNVAVINVKSEKKPQLSVQHLPAVDIDTEPPSSVSSITEHHQSPERDGRAEICEPDDGRLPGQSSPSQFSHYLAVADEDVEPRDESEDELPAPGISLPGHYSETRRPYHGPPFPPQAPPSIPSRAGPSSEQLAADMRKDLIENKALEWIEQELMARMISELYSKQTAVQPRPDSPDSSIASSSNDSIVDSIGPAGLQLFVDAGQAVDHTLVSALVREVLEEKVTTVLGQHDRDIPRRQASPTPQATASPVVPRSPVPTPEVTPQPSPVHTPPRAVSLVATPLASPSHTSPAESETENLEDLAQTMDATDEPIAAPAAHVATPINTPPPSPPPDIATPPLSPRESPKLISVIDGSILTPVPTPQPVSPEPEIEESVELPPSPEPVVIEEEPIPPTPTPSLPTPSTPSTPSLSTATTTQPSPSTETAGRSISEGEWLISAKSEGQIDSTEDEPGAIGLPEISSSTSIDSTLMGAEELEPDVQDELSEGEISPVKRTPRLHTRDPVVAILAHMSQRPDPSAALPYFPSQTLHNNGTKSLGEVSVGQCPNLTPSSERMLFKEAYGTDPPELTPRSEVRREVSGGAQPNTARQPVDDFTLRVSHLERTDVEDETDESDTVATVQTKQARPHPAPRIIQVAGKRPSPSPEPEDDNGPYPSKERYGDSRRRGEMDVEHEEEKEHEEEEDVNNGGIHGRGGLPPRASIPSNLFGTQTMSDLGSRTLTPDALNLEALLQSGYLSQTFSQSEGGTSDFESLRPMGRPLGSTGPTFHQAPYDDTQNITEGSVELPESRDPGARIPGMMSFSVTLPSAVESQGIDLSQTISEGEIPVPDTTSDVSELSGGEL